MNHWVRRRRGVACAGLAALTLILGGCGRMDNRPTIVGVVSPEVLAAVPVSAYAPKPVTPGVAALAPGLLGTTDAAGTTASRAAGPAGATAQLTERSVALPAAPAAGTGVATKGAKQPRAAAAGPARTTKKAGRGGAVAAGPSTAAAAGQKVAGDAAAPSAAVLAMPAPGGQVYDLSGSSSMGPPPKTMALTVADVPGSPGAQRWTFEGRTPNGNGVIENLTLARGADGVYMSAYRLELLAGLSMIFDFVPTAAVLLFPDRPQAGQSWEFDLVSTDGCASVSTEGILAAARADDAGTRHLRFTSTLVSTGKSACLEVNARRVQDVWQTGGSALPTRLDSDLAGNMGGVPVSARTSATLRQDVAATKPRRL